MDVQYTKKAIKDLSKLSTDLQKIIKVAVHMYAANGRSKSVKKIFTVFGDFYELCLHTGPGYRVYFRKVCGTLQVIMVGIKKDQKQDVKGLKRCA